MIPSDEFAQRYLVDIARFYMDIEGPNSDVGGNFSHEDVMRQLFNSPLLDLLNADDVSQLLGLMIEKDLIVEHPDLFAGSFYEVKEGYLAQYDDERDRKKTVLWHCHNFGDEWAQKALAGIFSDADLDEEPGTHEKFDSNDASSKWDDAVWDESASPDQWEPLPLERSGPDYEAALEMTEAAYAEISGNNGYAESEPEERERIVWSLSEAVRQMREGMPSRDQILVMAVKPLKYIAEKFSGASMGEAAKAAVKAIWAWLGGG